jgi:hypothetical protein
MTRVKIVTKPCPCSTTEGRVVKFRVLKFRVL